MDGRPLSSHALGQAHSWLVSAKSSPGGGPQAQTHRSCLYHCFPFLPPSDSSLNPAQTLPGPTS